MHTPSKTEALPFDRRWMRPLASFWKDPHSHSIGKIGVGICHRLMRVGNRIVFGLTFSVATAQTTQPPFPPPAKPPLPKPAVEQIRELLSASPEIRERYLAQKSPKAAALIRVSLKQFESASANERELLLRVLQLHQQLVPLLQAEPKDRAQLLAQTPEEDRGLLEDRLKSWDGLPAEARRFLLTNPRSLNYFIQIQRTPTSGRDELLGQLPEADRRAFETQFERWLELPDSVRAKTTSEFAKFFELTPSEREKTLRRLSEVERRQMAETLKIFAEMPPQQRSRCLSAFRKFSGMSANERNEFLQSAARWREMDPDERAAWRRLVSSLSSMPPMPPIPQPRSFLVATNQPPETPQP